MVEQGPLIQALSGILGQIFSSSITYPLDVIKTRVQTSHAHAGSNTADVDDSFTGMLQLILEESGVAGLYHGIWGEFSKESVKTFVYFYSYVEAKRRLAEHGRPLSVSRNLAAGALAAACGQLVNTPLNVAHTRMVAGTSSRGFVGTVAQIYREGGIAELYSGILPSLMLTCNPAINYAVYDQVKTSYLAWKRAQVQPKVAGLSAEKDARADIGKAEAAELSAMEAFAIGMLAKMVSTVVTYPLIRAKVVLQSNVTTYNSTVLLMLHLFKTEGFFGVFKGLKPQLLRAIFGGALLLMGKEQIQQVVRNRLASPPSESTLPTSAQVQSK